MIAWASFILPALQGIERELEWRVLGLATAADITCFHI
jgi:hypothetical protein